MKVRSIFGFQVLLLQSHLRLSQRRFSATNNVMDDGLLEDDVVVLDGGMGHELKLRGIDDGSFVSGMNSFNDEVAFNAFPN